MKKIYIGSDHGGFDLKQTIITHLTNNKYEVIDLGCHNKDSVDYPDIAKEVCTNVLSNKSLGILVCGTGIGMSIAANKIKGIRASLVSDCFSAQVTREHNDSNILCLGERVIGQSLAIKIVDSYVNATFEGDRHLRRVNKIKEIEDNE